MFDFDYVMKKGIKKHNPNCEEIPDHPYRILIAGGPGSGKSFHFKRKVLIVFDDLIADMVSNKTFNLIVTELFFRESKLNISLVFITQSYLAVPKKIRLNSTPYFVTKIPTKENFHKMHLIFHQICTFKTS